METFEWTNAYSTIYFVQSKQNSNQRQRLEYNLKKSFQQISNQEKITKALNQSSTNYAQIQILIRLLLQETTQQWKYTKKIRSLKR